jgi:hypothetical protein
MSKDNTLSVSFCFKKEIKILHKRGVPNAVPLFFVFFSKRSYSGVPQTNVPLNFLRRGMSMNILGHYSKFWYACVSVHTVFLSIPIFFSKSK